MQSQKLEFRVTLFVNEDGTYTAQGENLRGLVLETENLEEMRKELLRLTPRLLRANHGLSDDEIEEALIHISRSDQKPPRRRSPSAPRLTWDDVSFASAGV